MKRSTKQALSALLAIVMMLGMLIVPTVAADTTYTIDIATMAVGTANAESDFAAGEVPSYFTLNGVKKHTNSAGERVDYVQFAKSGGNSISFTTAGAATLTVKVRGEADDAAKAAALTVKKGDTVVKTTAGTDSVDLPSKTVVEAVWELAEAGTYTISNTASTGRARAEVITVVDKGGATTTDPTTPPEGDEYNVGGDTEITDTYIWTPSEADAFAQGELPSGSVKTVGTDGFFTIRGGNKIALDSGKGTFSDGVSTTYRLKEGTTHKVTGGDGPFTENCLSFESRGATKLTIWWKPGGTAEDKPARYLAVWTADGTEVVRTKEESKAGADALLSVVEIPEAGEYYIVSPANGCNICQIQADVTRKAGQTTVTTYKWTPAEADAFSQGELPSGSVKNVGDEGFFTIRGGNKIALDSGKGTFSDGVSTTYRLKEGTTHKVTGGDGPFTENCLSFESRGATKLTIWWKPGGTAEDKPARYLAVWTADGTEVVRTKEESKAGADALLSVVEIPEAGEYYIVSPANGCNICQIQAEVTTVDTGELEEKVAPWTLAAICKSNGGKIDVTPKDDGAGNITVSVKGPQVGTYTDNAASIIYTCADSVTIALVDKDGKVIESQTFNAKGNTHSAKFQVLASGDYTVKVSVNREGEQPLTAPDATVTFKLPLAKPVVKNATSAGGGKMTVNWGAVSEATGYNVYMDDATTPVNGETKLPGTATSYTVEGLEIGSKHTFKVEVFRGEEKAISDASEPAEVTLEARRAWTFKSFGPSSSQDHKVMGYEGGVNAGESLDLWSVAGNGKIKKGSDGLAYYFTEVPADENFYVKAKIHVNYWAYSGAQEGFGIMAADTMQNVDQAASGGVGAGKDKDYWTNNHMIAVTKTESDSDGFSPSGRLGIMMYSETGVTTDPRKDPGSAMVNYNTNLDARAVGEKMTGVKFYNIVGNMGGQDLDGDGVGDEHDKYEGANDDSGKVQFPETANVVNFDTYTQGRYSLVTDFWMELKRTNDGYFATWYAEDGKTVIKTASRPHPNLDYSAGADVLAQEDDLLKQDPTTVNVGFIASRHAHVTVSDVTFETTKKVDDPAPVPPPTKIVKPTIKIASSTTANTEDYNLILTSNLVGTATVKLNGEAVTLASGEPIKLNIQEGDYTDIKYGDRRADVPLKLRAGNNSLEVTFTPAPNEEQLYSYQWSVVDPNMPFVTTTTTINLDNKRADRANIYVAPNGSSTGTGSKERPMTLIAAVKIAQPGQKIVLMEGTYKFSTSVEIPRSISGKPGEMIYMIADPEATSRPVLDFMSRANVGVKVNGDYWYLEGFDVTRSQDRSAGINVGGHYNTLVDLRTYLNGNSGIQISRSGSADGNLATWPSNNLILNCISYLNADAGNEDADGFAAKLTCGPGNVFRGCISAYNADDGWDLYAKSTTTGPIGQVTLENCVAFKNGILLVDAADTNANPRPVLPREGITLKEVPGANGNGFKLGGENLAGHHILRNSYAFWNKGKGIDSNSCPDIEIYNNVSYSNGNSNVALYSGATTGFKAQGLVSFKDKTAPTYSISTTANGGMDVYENLKPVDQPTSTDYQNDTTFYWLNGKTVNAGGKEVDAATLFESLVFDGITYDAKAGTYSMGDFLKLKADADKVVGEGVLPNDNPEAPTMPGGKPDTTVDPSLDPEDPVKKPSGGGNRGDSSVGGDDQQPGNETVPGLPFTDVKKSDWFADSVKKAFDKGLMKGVEAERFAPNSNTTRAMVATVLFRMDGENKTDVASLFNDVDGDTWFTDAVAWAADKGIVKGYSDTAFGPNDNVTREQLAVMLYRYAAPETKSEKDLSAFNDAASVSDWATEAITWAVDKGIMNGKGDGRLDPKGLATRAEICTMLVRFLDIK